MPDLDDYLSRELRRSIRDVDPVGLSAELDRRRERHGSTQRLKKAALVITVVAGTVMGTLGLTRVFGDASTNPRAAVGPGTGRIVFSNYVRGPSGSSVLADDWHLYTMNADGSDLVRIGPDSVDEVLHPSWSPDGSRIAFQGWTNLDDGIYVMNADGTDLTEILTTDATHDIFQIAWSPDGTQIGYVVQEQEQIGPTPVAGAPQVDIHYTIWTANIDGSNATQRTSEGREFSLDWSPDGTKIVFERYAPTDSKSTSDGRDLGVASDLFIMNSDGSGEMQLTTDGNASDPAWSPDGTRIAYSGDGGPDVGLIDLFVMNADGSNPIRITSDPGNEYNPVWSPDGSENLLLDPRAGSRRRGVRLPHPGDRPGRDRRGRQLTDDGRRYQLLPRVVTRRATIAYVAEMTAVPGPSS